MATTPNPQDVEEGGLGLDVLLSILGPYQPHQHQRGAVEWHVPHRVVANSCQLDYTRLIQSLWCNTKHVMEVAHNVHHLLIYIIMQSMSGFQLSTLNICMLDSRNISFGEWKAFVNC